MATVQFWPHNLHLLLFFALCLSFFSATSCAPTSPTNSPEFVVDQESGRLKDVYGRERIFHGLNVVVKGPPWHPSTDHFDSIMSLSPEDIKLLKGFGMNSIRLGVMWPGVEPQRGTMNETYLDVMRSLVRRLAQEGIYSLVEMHQDVLVDRFCGEGIPLWLLNDAPDNGHRDDVQLALSGAGEEAHTPTELGGGKGTALTRKLLEVVTDGSSAKERGQSRAKGEVGEWRGAAAAAAAAKTKKLVEAEGVKGDEESSLGIAAEEQARQGTNGFSNWNLPCFFTGTCKPWEYAETFPEPLASRYMPDAGTNGSAVNPEVPSEEQCLSIAWGNYHFSYAVARAFQDLYENTWGWADMMANYWATLARTFKDEPGILGYELINEPWVGDQYSDPLLLIPGLADFWNLQPFYDKLQAAIWAEDQSHLLFFESIVFDNFYCGFTHVPGGDDYANMSVLSYHYYKPPNFGVQQTFSERARESQGLKCGSFLTEFGLPPPGSLKDAKGSRLGHMAKAAALVAETLQKVGPEFEASQSVRAQKLLSRQSLSPESKRQASLGEGFLGQEFVRKDASSQELLRQVRLRAAELAQADAAETEEREARLAQLRAVEPSKSDSEVEKMLLMLEVEEVLTAADSYVQSWIGWEYKAYVNKTGTNFGPFNKNGSINVEVARMIARTFPRAVAGSITSFSFNPVTSAFSLSYVAAPREKGQVAAAGQPTAAEEDLAATTEVWFHREFYYPLGVEISVDPPSVGVTEEDNLIFLRHGPELAGLPIRLTLMPQIEAL